MSMDREDENTTRDYRSRSRSPRDSESSNLPLSIVIPQSLSNQVDTNEIIEEIIKQTRVNKIHFIRTLEAPDFSDGIAHIIDRDVDKKFEAYGLVMCTKILKEMIKRYPPDTSKFEIQILIPPHMVSQLIGKHGKQINTLQTRSNTEISVIDKTRGLSERQVKIAGKPRDVEFASRSIYELISERKQSPERREQKSIVKFIIPACSSGYLIGKNGQFTKRIKSQYDTDLKVIKSEGPPCQDNENIAVTST